MSMRRRMHHANTAADLKRLQVSTVTMADQLRTHLKELREMDILLDSTLSAHVASAIDSMRDLAIELEGYHNNALQRMDTTPTAQK